ncbi:SMI1/KNR4 family protein [Vitreoscilla massiliensis]|uniref:SMI1/KNR4 family protein n=1 Tax=Vitreoscilla massiliensis TaxID=1689272 RepID=A0ABY4E1Z2_9NEIS|nr:SMI1/KNR4 family protein [Vitreoscilla massiliensis]UOO89338.1 SMI1/KNR4 family protein [Vitreoscilla massiliensis]
MLLTYAEIETALLRHFAHVVDDDEILDLHDLLLIPHLLSPNEAIVAFEQALAVVLPHEFVQFLNHYQVDDFAIANVQFGHGENYLHHVWQMNQAGIINSWWQGDKRPVNRILIAIAETHAIILDVTSGEVLAVDSEEKDAVLLACGFDDFFRAVASVYLNTVSVSEALAYLQVDDCGFWQQLPRLPTVSA